MPQEKTDVRAVFGIRERRFKVGFEWSGCGSVAGGVSRKKRLLC